MPGAQLICRTISGAGTLMDHTMTCRPISSSHCYSSGISFSIQLLNLSNRQFICRNPRKLKPSVVVIACKSSFGRFGHESEYEDEGRNYEDHDDDNYVEALILLSETIRHHRMRMRGFQDETSRQSSSQLVPFSLQRQDPIGSGFLRHFKSPTIFLRISCDGDFVLPISVGEYAVAKIIDAFDDENIVECPNQFQFVRTLTEKLGYQVKMVKITKRVVNTYYASICLHKPGEKTLLCLDARPSDAINVAIRCKAPIYVNKHIVLTDATKIFYGTRRMSNKTVYDVSLDSAPDDPDTVSEELNLVRNMNLAAEEERYSDAAMWRDKLVKLRDSGP